MDPVAVLEVAIGAGLAGGAYRFARRFGGSSALEELERANGILERRVDVLTKENAELRAEVAKLSASRDLSVALQPVLTALTTHEELASRRADATLHVLDMIAGKLGAEPEAA